MLTPKISLSNCRIINCQQESVTTQHLSHPIQTQETTMYPRPQHPSNELFLMSQNCLTVISNAVRHFMPPVTGFYTLGKLFCDFLSSHSFSWNIPCDYTAATYKGFWDCEDYIQSLSIASFSQEKLFLDFCQLSYLFFIYHTGFTRKVCNSLPFFFFNPTTGTISSSDSPLSNNSCK